MKIYFAGPLFTPYVRQFISKHAKILRDHGITVFVPHEQTMGAITDEMVESLIAKNLVSRDDLDKNNPAATVEVMLRKGALSRKDAGLPEMTDEYIFDVDYEGLSTADAVLAILDGTQVDDGTACEIGIFYGLSLQDQSKKGIVGLMTDSRGVRRAETGFGLNYFVLGVLEELGPIYDNFDDVLAKLLAWHEEVESN